MKINMFNEINKTLNIIEGQKQYPELKLHENIRTQFWTLSMWKENEISFRPQYIIDEIEALEYELYNDIVNRKNTCPRPLQVEIKRNILTLIGLTESAKRDTGEVATTINWNSIGTSNTAEVEGNTNLGAEDSGGSYARRVYSTNGQRKVVNQTAKYGMSWLDTQISAAGLQVKESGQHWHLSDLAKMHSRVTFTTFDFQAGNIFVTQINELMENGSA